MSFGILFLLLLMVVAAAIGLLFGLASYVPAFSAEFNALAGRAPAIVDPAKARKAQFTLALAVYSAPLLCGLLVAGIHRIVILIERVWRRQAREQDRGFEM